MTGPSTEELERRKELAERVVREAGAHARDALMRREGLIVETKGTQDWVTNVDVEVERLIRDRLGEARPREPVVGEEIESAAAATGGSWVVDPIDGTTCYFLGLPQWCVALAYVFDGRPVVAAVFAPMTDELFSARAGGGTFFNGKPMRVSDATSVGAGLIAIGANREADPEKSGRFISELVKDGGMYIRVGACALALAYVASGRLLAAYEPLVSPWDDLAGMLLVREAGGHTNEYEPSLAAVKRPVLATVPALWGKLSPLLHTRGAAPGTVGT